MDPLSKTKRTSAIQRLAQLPEVFDLGHFALLAGISPASAKVMLSRWSAQGLIAHAGPHAGLYYKRLAQQWSRDDQTACAILTLYPAAIVSGASVLHAHGWTTQIPRSIHVSVPRATRSVQLFDVTLTQRPMSWFRLVHEHSAWALDLDSIIATGNPWDRLRKLSPAWALVDLLRHTDGWQPDPDDLDIPLAAHAAIRYAAQALGLGCRYLMAFGIGGSAVLSPEAPATINLDY